MFHSFIRCCCYWTLKAIFVEEKKEEEEGSNKIVLGFFGFYLCFFFVFSFVFPIFNKNSRIFQHFDVC